MRVFSRAKNDFAIVLVLLLTPIVATSGAPAPGAHKKQTIKFCRWCPRIKVDGAVIK
jgi:hypothetical protein